ncbi:MAG TPA: prepilin-type N-terminal cleavage/methylation domain-containing protein [Myxococcota bacterium]|nr:prepilin-type N-terminal cleavage/methylation domain-containing protein [Myxococcota bacterium]
MKPSDARRGFTLIEMLAATALFAVVVIVLGPIVVESSQREGLARRKAAAALFADRLVAEAEEAAASGAAPQLTKRERTEEEFTATIETTAFDPAAIEIAGAQPAAQKPAEPAATGWLDSPTADTAPPIVQLDVRVAWVEGVAEQEVRRTSFFLNPAALEALEQNDAAEDQEPPQ